MNLEVSKSTYELLQPIINQINGTCNITAVQSNADGSFTLSICNTLWATNGFIVSMQGNQYTIVSFVPNQSITVLPLISGNTPTIGSFTLYAPKFYHGTINATQTDLSVPDDTFNRVNYLDKLPMIWLHEPIDETNNTLAKLSPIARQVACELWFLVDYDFTQSNANHYQYAIKPMRNLIAAFYEALKYSGAVDDNLITNFITTDTPLFGRYSASGSKGKDVSVQIFNSFELSGTKLQITVPFLRSYLSNCC